jgi:hypothetical protein
MPGSDLDRKKSKNQKGGYTPPFWLKWKLPSGNFPGLPVL